MVESMTMTSAAVHWSVLLALFLCVECVHAVTVNVTDTVVTEESTAEVILPCEFVLESPNHVCNIRWDMGGGAVIVKDTLNQVFHGDKYTGRVKWGDGCSLILFNPCLNDTGNFGFTIVEFGDQTNWERANVELKVIEARTKETTSGVNSVRQSTVPTSADKPTEDRRTSPAWEHFISMTVVSMASVISQILFLRYRKRQGHIDAQDKLYLEILIVFSVTGFLTMVVSMAVGFRIPFRVSCIAITLPVVTHSVHTCVHFTKITQESSPTTKKPEEEQKEKCLGSTQIDL